MTQMSKSEQTVAAIVAEKDAADAVELTRESATAAAAKPAAAKKTAAKKSAAAKKSSAAKKSAAKKTTSAKKSTAKKSSSPRAPRGDETKIAAAAEQLTSVEAKLKRKPDSEELIAERDRLIVELIKLNAGFSFIAKTRGVPTSTNRGLCRVLMGGKRL